MPPKKSKQAVGASTSRAASKGCTTRSNRRREKEITEEEDQIPEPLPWEFINEEDEQRYATFGKRVVLGSKYIDDDALEHVELLAEVEQFISNICWRGFMSKKRQSFYEITKEVMCSFSTTANRNHDSSEYVISFQCMGERRKLSLGEVRVIMGFPEGDRWPDSSFNVNKAWHELTGQLQWKHSLAKSTFLKNPAIRYLHRVLVHTIFGRADSMGSVTMPEVFILWSMLHNNHVDGSLFFIRHLATIAGHSSGIIRVSGMITILAEYFGFDPENDSVCTRVPGRDRIDLSTMENMNMIRRQGEQFYLIGPDGFLIQKQLPHNTADAEEGERTREEETGEERENVTMDFDREPIRNNVAEVLRKRRWVSAGPRNTIRLEANRSPNVEVNTEYRARPQPPPRNPAPFPFIPITPLEGSTYMLSVRVDKLSDRLQHFENFSSQQFALQETRRQQMEQRWDRRFENFDGKMDLLMRHLHIDTGAPSSSQADPEVSPATTPENTPPDSPLNPPANPFHQSDD